MIDFLDKWTREIELILKYEKKGIDWKRVLEDHRAVIGFLQHERLIHLLVTLVFGVMFLLVMTFSLFQPMGVLLVVDFLLVILLIPYIWHYFKLENGVQRLYWLDKEIQNRLTAGSVDALKSTGRFKSGR